MDHTGSYVYSFYMTGAVVLVAFLIPMILIPINIIEVSKVFLRATSMTINKWLQKDRKGSRLRDKLPITIVREKSLKKVL